MHRKKNMYQEKQEIERSDGFPGATKIHQNTMKLNNCFNETVQTERWVKYS